MFFDVMSERDAIAFSRDGDILPSIIISIRNKGDAPVCFAENPEVRAILRLYFNDSEEELPTSLTDADAESIVRFVEGWQGKVEQIVVHCTEGVSRSAGVCAALMRRMGEDENEIFGDRRYRPNMRCYRKVLTAKGTV